MWYTNGKGLGDKMRILFPITEKKGKDSMIAWHFGRSPYFAIYDTKTDKLEFFENKLEEIRKQVERPVEALLKHNINAVFAKGIGVKALEFFRSHGIVVKTGECETIKEVIENEEKLKELEKACKEKE